MPKVKLPDFYDSLRADETILPMEDDEQVPDAYYLQDDAPTVKFLTDEGAVEQADPPVYWLNVKTRVVSRWDVPTKKWVPDPSVPAYVVNEETEAIGKIVKKEKPVEVKKEPELPPASFEDAMKVVDRINGETEDEEEESEDE